MEKLVGTCDWRLRNMTQFYNPVREIFRPIFIILANFSTQIYHFETENYNFKIQSYIFCSPERKTDIIVCLEYC